MKYRLYRKENRGVILERIDSDNSIPFEITPDRSQRVWNHSPDGFEFGYGGSGPSQTALAILLDAINNDDGAVFLHQDFKWEFIAPLPHEGGEIEMGQILKWIAEKITGTRYNDTRRTRPKQNQNSGST